MAHTKQHSCELRKGRYSQPGNYYFLTTAVANRRRIFAASDHAVVVLDSIRWLDSARQFIVDAAVVMPDHLHFVGQLGDSTLARVMHSLKSFSANKLAAAGVSSPVWQDGYHDHGLRKDEGYRARVAYVLQNPLRARLVQRLEDYPHMILPIWWRSDERMD